MLVEGPHESPLGERIPILSTWSHLKVLQEDVARTGIQHNFAFYENQWWEAKFQYDYKHKGIDYCPYVNSYWCKCNLTGYRSPYTPYPCDLNIEGHPHVLYKKTYEEYTIFRDTKQTDFYKFFKGSKDLGVMVDWLEERGDGFANYLRNMHLPRNPWHPRVIPDLHHMCQSINLAKNDRAAKLLLLAEGITR
jgi:hypothetical protein